MRKFIILMLPSRLREVRGFSVSFTEPIEKNGKKLFRFTYILGNNTRYFDISGTKKEVEDIEERIKDFNNDRTSETLVVEYNQKEKMLTFRKFETNEKAIEFLNRRKVKYPYII